MTLHNVIQFAYLPCDGRPLLDNQIIGAPGWADADTYDIEAKAESRAQPIRSLSDSAEITGQMHLDHAIVNRSIQREGERKCIILQPDFFAFRPTS